MRVLMVLPIVLPLSLAVLSLFFHRSRWTQRALAIGGMLALVIVSILLLAGINREGIRAIQAGGWPAPIGISLVADRLSSLLILATSVLGLAVSVYSVVDVGRVRQVLNYYPLLHVLMAGVCGIFLTGDLFNLYVWYEVMLIASFVLVALGGTRGQVRAGLKYVAINLVASGFFLAAVGIIYGVSGTLNLADLSLRLPEVSQKGVLGAAAMLLFTAFSIKAAFFPFYFWLPASYPAPPIAVSALFAGLLTKAGVYSLLRVGTLIFPNSAPALKDLLLWLAGATMIVGGLGALAQVNLRRIFAYQIVSHVGFMLMGLALFSTAAIAGAIFYLLHDMVVKTNLFLVSGLVERARGSGDISRVRGITQTHPNIAGLYLVPALSLSGIPPLAGFVGKLALLQAGVADAEYVIVGVALLATLLTLASMTMVWREAFWGQVASNESESSGQEVDPRVHGKVSAWLTMPTAGLALTIIALSVMAAPLMAYCSRTAGELLDRTAYLRAVLGGGP